MMGSRDMWPEPYHIMVPYRNQAFTTHVKKPSTRTVRPPKYYIIDYGLSRQYSLNDYHPTETTPIRRFRITLKFQNDFVPYDTLAVNIYCSGDIIQESTLEVSHIFSLDVSLFVKLSI